MAQKKTVKKTAATKKKPVKKITAARKKSVKKTPAVRKQAPAVRPAPAKNEMPAKVKPLSGLARLMEEVKCRKEKVYQYLQLKDRPEKFQPEDIYCGVHKYLKAGGKSLRPAVLLLACGAVGGDEDKAIPAAAAVEVYHTWTLVHDDIIDRDGTRRGVATVHEELKNRAIKKLGLKGEEAAHYGQAMAILAGDLQQGWTISLLTELAREKGISPILVLQLILDLEVDVQCNLIEGEALDLQYSKVPIEALSEEKILAMLWKKTGALYQFAGRAGAMIGIDQPNSRHPYVEALSLFTSNCGIAFQLQDDILGILADEKKLGKPVGSDIREGKRTVIVYHALGEANRKEKSLILKTLNNSKAAPNQVKQVTKLFQELGSIAYTAEMAQKYVRKAVAALETLPDSEYKKLLMLWADYMINREF
ncbi:MAG: polyprenyl synthetase family protein [Candidatus Edwardsbacteria bacterium]|nr:polyprenyl synthetase family protein [Candidatus Edwardsbacteria bacterium]